jgi:DNA-binding transcriptional MocR family regulator
MLEQDAWKALGAVARALYIELASKYYGSNNGQIIYSVRQAAKALKISKDTAARALEELQRHGFIAVQQKGGFNLKEQKGQATVWRLTEFVYGSAVSGTKDFTRWSAGNDFPLHRGPKPTHKRKQKPTPLANYMCPKEGTAALDNSSFKSQEKDQNVVSKQHESQQRDWLVLKGGPQVSPQRPCFEIRRSRVAS